MYTDFNNFFTVRTRNLWRVKRILRLPPHLYSVTALPSKTYTTAIYGSYCKIKTGVSLFWTTLYAIYFSESANVSWSVPAASSQSEGYYTCNVSNTAGSATATTYLDIKGIYSLLSSPIFSAPVCLSICPSHGWISQRRLKLGSCNLHHRVAK